MHVVQARLLTPVGLRSLAPGEREYKPRYYGDLRSRDAAYHQGTVWAWLIGPFIDAWLKVHPSETAAALKSAEERTAGRDGLNVNIAVGYGGRREIADAVRSLLQEHAAAGASLEDVAEVIDVDHIADHLYTKGQPDPDLVIRTSGEQRLGGFLLWQSVHSEFYFCDALWPDFRKIDFLRALRDFGTRQRRYGG